MRFIKNCALLLIVMVQIIAGCGGGGGSSTGVGGGGGGGAVVKTATLKVSSQSINPTDLIGGFLFTVILPVGATLPTDTFGTPLSSAVYLSGQFAGVSPQINLYDSATRKLTVSYASPNEYHIGEFITVLVTVPSTYVLNSSDITITVFNAFAPLTGEDMPAVFTAYTFN